MLNHAWNLTTMPMAGCVIYGSQYKMKIQGLCSKSKKKCYSHWNIKQFPFLQFLSNCHHVFYLFARRVYTFTAPGRHTAAQSICLSTARFPFSATIKPTCCTLLVSQCPFPICSVPKPKQTDETPKIASSKPRCTQYLEGRQETRSHHIPGLRSRGSLALTVSTPTSSCHCEGYHIKDWRRY